MNFLPRFVRLVGVTVLSFSLVAATKSFAEPIVILDTDLSRDTRSLNNIGFRPGDRLTLFAAVQPNPLSDPVVGLDTSVSASLNTTNLDLFFAGSQPFFPNEYSRSIAYDPALTGSWTISATNPADPNSPVTALTPAVGNAGTTEFVENMSLTGNGVTPTLNWQFPASSVRDTVQVRIYDHQQFDAFGFEKLIHLEFVDPNQTSFDIPSILNDNNGMGLVIGDRYTIAIISDERRSDRSVAARSRSFFEFVAVDFGDTPVFIPTVGPDNVYRFDIAVQSGQMIIVDPFFSVGFDYEVGPGDPFFESVLLPSIGDDIFELYLFDAMLGEFVFQTNLMAGRQYFFDPGGVDLFRILGIELSAEIDPLDFHGVYDRSHICW